VARLIVNADDFGLTAGVNRAVVELHKAGVLTSTTLMARAQASQEAIEMARSTPALGVGCHIVLVDGEPVLPAHRIPTLLDGRSGRFPASLIGFLARLSTRRIRPAQIEDEVRAQIEFLLSRGVRLTHVDTHKHTHMFPTVLCAVLRAARQYGIRAVRNPFEPAWAVHATNGAPWLRPAEVGLLRRLQPVWQRIIAEEKFATTDGTIAVAGTGVLNAAMLRSLLRQLPEGTWELVTHPGYNDRDLSQVRTRLRASRDIERQALQTVREFPAIRLTAFADL
jgi:hopanoid biosynthesis associated protein HpnK